MDPVSPAAVLFTANGRQRMNFDRDKKRRVSAVDCGITIVGQESPDLDIALFSRMVHVPLSKTVWKTR
ncbi:MAG: hypothetical protein HDS31_00455 [Bacteroides sp.]|nr:hypothetical protein [Bacteroides sp.]